MQPVGLSLASRTVSVEVAVAIEITRPGWEQTGYGEVWGEVDTEHELRALVTYGGPDDEPEVVWLDEAALDRLNLTDAELTGAIEQAEEAGYQVLMSRPAQDEPGVARADYEYDQRNEDALLGVA